MLTYFCFYFIAGFTDNPFETPTLVGHSLSWKNEKLPRIGPDNKMHAKIWRPEDPCTSREQHVENINCDKANNDGLSEQENGHVKPKEDTEKS